MAWAEKFSTDKRMELPDKWAYYYPDDPYILVYDFFWDDTLCGCKSGWDYFWRAAFTSETEDSDIGINRIVSAYIDMLKLTETAYSIYASEQLAAIMPGGKGLLRKIQRIRVKLKDAKDYPAHLSLAEWQKPRLVCKSFCSRYTLQSRKAVLYYLLRHALMYESMAAEHPAAAEIAGDYLDFVRLMEAMWLIRITELPPWK